MEQKTKFYTCYQNNSGGYLIQNDNVDRFVCVEAKNVKEAQYEFEEILGGYREFCPCCGQRWDDDYLDEDDGEETPCIYGENYKVFNDSFWCRDAAIIIYYANGTKEKYYLSQNLIKQHKGE